MRMLPLLLVFALVSPVSANAQVSDDTETVPFPYIPNATFAEIAFAARVSSDTLLDEPIAMQFIAVGFGTEAQAADAFQPLVDHYFEGQQAILDSTERYDYRMVSVGRLGDDRAAFASESRDIIFESTSKDVHVFVRVGHGILYTRAIAVGGETIEYVAEYLTGFLPDRISDPAGLIPTLSDLPVGWELLRGGPKSILGEVTAEPTPTPTATPPPSPTPISTPTPRPSPTPTLGPTSEPVLPRGVKSDATPVSDDETLPDGAGSADDGQGGGDARSLAEGEVWYALSDIDGDGDRLGFNPSGDLIFSTNPGRVSLEQNGITLEPTGGQGVNACDQGGSCVDITTLGGDSGGYEDYPLGWIGSVVIYERANGDTYPLEFHAVTLNADHQPIDDRVIGGGESTLATLIRPYPANGGLLVPTPDSWLLLTADAMQVIDDNPYGRDLGQIRFDPNGNAISYVSGGTLIRASLSEPGTPLVQLPYNGEDYDFSPNGDRLAVRTGDTIEILDLAGTVQATYTGDGHRIGSLVWANEGLFYVDTTDGVLRLIQP
jgi:hypothetical protein